MLRALAIDFNSFFASVEQQERPELRGRPVGIVPVMAETTGRIAVSIEAKALGLTRNARVVEARPEVYIDYNRRLKAIVESCVPMKKIQFIDELECELSGDFAAPAHALALAKKLQAKILREAGSCLRSSIGIGPNWFIAKVASDMQKPDGLVLLDEGDIPQKLLHLGLRDFCGIGGNMEKRLRPAGIDTVEKFYAASRARLRAIWGSVEGARFYGWMRGEPQAREQTRFNTIGHGHVLPPRCGMTRPRSPCCTASCKRPPCACATRATTRAACIFPCAIAMARAGAMTAASTKPRTRCTSRMPDRTLGQPAA